MSRPAPDQLRPARGRIDLLWVIVLGMVLVMLTGTLLAAVDGVVRGQERSLAERNPRLHSG